MPTSNESRLKMRTYRVRVLVVPPIWEMQLGVSESRHEIREIQGYTLKDAMRREGIR